MPAGCDFICQNENCNFHKTGFTIAAPWPIANINMIISNINTRFQGQLDYKEQLLKWRDEGRKYACIIFPNEANIPSEGYRINMWDDKHHIIHSYDVFLGETDSLENAINRDIPKTASDGTLLKSFSETTNEGILCPHCKQKMEQSRWFSNTK